MPIWRQRVGKLAKSLSDPTVAVDLGPDYDMTDENSLEGTQVVGCHFRRI
jgi:hypothetical protein